MTTRRPSGFVGLTFAFATVMLGATLPTPMYASWADQLGFGVLTTTVIFATYAGGVLVALVVFGRFSDAVGRRPLLWAGVGAAALSGGVFLLADSVPALLVARLLSGLSAGIVTPTATAAVIEAAPPAWRARAPAVATVANIGGLGAGPIVAGLLVEYAPSPLRLSFAVHLVMLGVAAAAVALAPETSERRGGLGLQRLSVPAATRPLFLAAATAAFAGFAVTGLFTAVAPSFAATVIGIDNAALAGALAGSLLVASAIAQPLAIRIPPARAVAVGCAVLVAGMAALAVSLRVGSLAGLVAAAVVAGAGQGISFSRGLAAVAAATPAERRAEVASAYFVVAYVAISLPVIGEGVAAELLGLRTAGVGFAVAVAVVAAACLVAVLRLERRTSAG